MKTEVVWKEENDGHLLEEIKAFTQSLDEWQISLKTSEKSGKYILFDNNTFKTSYRRMENSFSCPTCGYKRFSILEGTYEDKPVLGLACNNCDSYGAVYIGGL